MVRDTAGGVRRNRRRPCAHAAPERGSGSLPSFGEPVWQTWTPALLGAPNNDATVPLLDVAYRQAPVEVVRRVQQLVRAKEAYVVHKLANILDERLARGIVDALSGEDVPTETLARALEPLLHIDAARAFAEGLLQSGGEKAVIAAASLLLHAANDSWDALWAAIAADPAFGRAVIERAADNDHMHAAPLYTLTEPRVADLYVWLCRAYPPEEDVIPEGIYTPDTRDNIASWRSRCLDSLKNRGTRAACEALRQIAEQRPEQAYLPPLIIEAEAIRRAKSWEPTPIAVLRQLVSDARRRQVRSETELADVIVESLARMEQKLQGETPAAVDLWNTGTAMRPKTENEFTDYVARHLRADLIDRGVVVGREVEIRRTIVPGSGERTDIHVDVSDAALVPALITVIVEVKGCWNRGVLTDLTDQLAHRYLRDNHTRTGVYLVGWFHCAAWDATDPRKAACADAAEPLLETLATAAAALRSEGVDVRRVVLDCGLRSADRSETDAGRKRSARRKTKPVDERRPVKAATPRGTSVAAREKRRSPMPAKKRELIAPRGDKRYIRRDDKGRITESDDVSRSLSQDRKRKAKTVSKTGQGDKGDRAPAKKSSAKNASSTKSSAKKSSSKKTASKKAPAKKK
jgi:hypothetical protein